MMFWLTLLLALLMALTHLLPKVYGIEALMGRSWMISGAGGVAVAYVFIHILPELQEHQTKLDDLHHIRWLEILENHAYLASMLGLSIFYGIERIVKQSKNQGKQGVSTRIFWVHIISFTLYNGLIGYLLVDRIEDGSIWNLLLFAVAMSLHFLVNDRSLREHHEQRYDKVGRWIMAGVLLIGWGIGTLWKIPEPMLGLLFAFLSGAILLNVMKEELPDQGKGNVWAFFAGSMVYAALLLFCQ